VKRADQLEAKDLLRDLEELRVRASVSLDVDGIPSEQQEVTYQADIRYIGQAFQISMDFKTEDIMELGISMLTERFDAEHEQLFTFALGQDHELVMIRAVVQASAASIKEVQVGQESASLEDCKLHDTRFYHKGEWHDAVIYDRKPLHTGLKIPGPAIISEMDSTTVILPAYEATVDVVGNLLINPVEQREDNS
jgi:N-methylhydantoinase A